MPKKVTSYEAWSVCVDTKENDAVDIRCGGPPMLGFDFFIDVEIPQNKAIEMVEKELKAVGCEPTRVIVRGKCVVQKLWTVEMIRKELKAHPSLL